MLSSVRISEFEPRLSLSPSSSRSRPYRHSRTFTTATQASTSRLPSPQTQSYFIPSCLSPSSAFYQVLTAPCRAASPLVRRGSLVDSRRVETRHDSTNWSKESTPSNETASYDGELAINDTTASIHTMRRIYTPHGRWAWADGLSIDDIEELMPLESGSTCSVSVKKGTLGDRRIKYLSKCWNTSQQHRWLGFYSELAIYKADRYLKPLQGDILPWVIGVHVLPGAISIAMEPPHHSFWIEASSDMPNVLKERCIESFEKIHGRGVLHGDVELRHMLIGGDGKVTITNFQASRALVPNLDVMLLQATPAELKLEMRKVKYKLDYDGARMRETEKMMRSEERERRNGMRELEALRPGQEGDQAEEDIPEDDIIDPPVNAQDWDERWANVAANAPPKRFVMPGQTSDTLERELQGFFAVLERMPTTQSAGKSSVSIGHRQLRFTSEISTRFIDPFPSEERVVPTADYPVHSYGLRKRKVDELSTSGTSLPDTHPSKRSRSDAGPSSLLMHKTEDEVEPVVSGLPADPMLVDYMPDQPLGSFTPPRTPLTEESVAPDVSPSTIPGPSEPRFPPIKVRDFVSEPYDGPRGYRVPYPAMDDEVKKNRRIWDESNRRRQRQRVGLGLSRSLAAEGTIASINSTSKRSISDRSLAKMTLGLNPSNEQALPGGAHTSARKRRHGDQESEMLEEDFLEDSRRFAKARVRPSHRQAAGPAAGPLVDLEYAQDRVVSQQDAELSHLLGSRAGGFLSSDRVVSTVRSVVSSRHSKLGERMAFATLGRLPPSSRIKSYSTSSVVNGNNVLGRTHSIGPSAVPSSTQSSVGESSNRTKTRRRSVFDIPRPSKMQRSQSVVVRSPSPASKKEIEEVEDLLSLPQIGTSPSAFKPPSTWMDYLLQWIP